MVKYRKIVFVFIIGLLLQSFLLNKEKDVKKCLELYEGYILKVVQKGNDPAKVYEMEYFFYSEKPHLDKRTTSESLFIEGARLMSGSYYRSVNLERTIIEDFVDYESRGEPFYTFKNKEYDFEIYRVIIGGYEERVLLREYLRSQNKYTSNTCSGLNYLSEKEKNKYIKIINPEIISLWN